MRLLETPWFRLLCVAVVAALLGLIFLAYLCRLSLRARKRLEHRLEVTLMERSRIARELHDPLMQGFQGLMFRLQAVRQVLPSRPLEALAMLDAALEQGDQAISEGRNAVTDMRVTPLEQGELIEALVALGDEFSETCGEPKPNYQVVVEGALQTLAPVLRDEVYRVTREAIRNAFRHAKAGRIEVELSFGASHFSIRVRDDGIGIDPQVLAQGKRSECRGLLEIRERTASFGGQLNVWSQIGAGTEVELAIPQKVAYACRRRSRWLPKRLFIG